MILRAGTPTQVFFAKSWWSCPGNQAERDTLPPTRRARPGGRAPRPRPARSARSPALPPVRARAARAPPAPSRARNTERLGAGRGRRPWRDDLAVGRPGVAAGELRRESASRCCPAGGAGGSGLRPCSASLSATSAGERLCHVAHYGDTPQAAPPRRARGRGVMWKPRPRGRRRSRGEP